MSSLPLISHHLFVAAVEAKYRAGGWSGWAGENRPAGVPARQGYRAAEWVSAPSAQLREVPVEWVDFGRPLPVEAGWAAEMFGGMGSA